MPCFKKKIILYIFQHLRSLGRTHTCHAKHWPTTTSFVSGTPHMIAVTETCPSLPQLLTLNDSAQWMIAANFFLKSFSAIQLHSHVIQLPLHKFILEANYPSDRCCWNKISLRFIGDSIAYALIAQAYYVEKMVTHNG